MSFTQPRVVAVVVAAAARVTDEGLKKALGSGWEASSLIKREGSMGLPLRGEIAVHFLRQAGDTDPSQFLSAFLAAGVVPMEELLRSVDPSFQEDLKLLWPKTTQTTQTTQPDDKAVIAEVAMRGMLQLGRADTRPLPWAVRAKRQRTLPMKSPPATRAGRPVVLPSVEAHPLMVPPLRNADSSDEEARTLDPVVPRNLGIYSAMAPPGWY